MTDTRKVTKEKVRELRIREHLAEHHILTREQDDVLLAILDRYEAALPLIEAALKPEWPERMYQNNDLTRAALALRESMEKGKGEKG